MGVTGVLRPEEALRRSEEDLRLLISEVQDYAIFMLSPSGVVITWNEGARSASRAMQRQRSSGRTSRNFTLQKL